MSDAITKVALMLSANPDARDTIRLIIKGPMLQAHTCRVGLRV